MGAALAQGATMLAFAVSLLLSPSPAVVTPRCDAQLEDIQDARRTLRGLRASQQLLLRRHARAGSRRDRLDIERLLTPISNQADALADELDRQERAYIRCIEAELDARPRPLLR